MTTPPTPNYTDEQQLITALIAGDDRAFCEIISRFQYIMVSIARAICGETFADDVVQDSWVAIHKNIGKFEQRSSLKTWVITIVSNEAKARLRRESRKISLDELD